MTGSIKRTALNLFVTVGLTVIFALVSAVCVLVGLIEPGPNGTAWLSIGVFMATLTGLMAFGLYHSLTITKPRFT